jgi:hypothetical protein
MHAIWIPLLIYKWTYEMLSTKIKDGVHHYYLFAALQIGVASGLQSNLIGYTYVRHEYEKT